MSTADDVRGRTRAHLRRAHRAAGTRAVDGFQDALERDELELAADALASFGDGRQGLPRSFWEALIYAFENLGCDHQAKISRFRIYESDYGFVEARLTLLPTVDGGRSSAITTDYRPSWNIGNRTASGEMEINDAPITVEDGASISPGGTARIRLHPIWRPSWRQLTPGQEIDMHEGSRVVGRALVLRVTLRQEG